MVLKSHDRIAEVQGRSGTFRIERRAMRNSRVAQADVIAGTYSAASELVPTIALENEREFQPSMEKSHTIRVTDPAYKGIGREAQPFETPSATIERLLSEIERLRRELERLRTINTDPFAENL